MQIATLRRTLIFSFLLTILVFSTGCSSNTPPQLMSQLCSGCQFLFATTNSGQILTFRLTPSGGLGTPTSTAGPANSAGLIALAPGLPQQLYVYVSDPTANAIRVYAMNATDATLAPASIGPYPLGDGNGSPGEMALFGNVIYIAGSENRLLAFTVNMDGSLTSVPGSPFAGGAGLSHLVVAPASNTDFLYASNANDANGSISAFKITSGGALQPVAGSPFPTVAGGGPAGFYQVGTALYVALRNANAVAAFAIAADGSLSPLPGSPFAAGHGTFSLNGADGFLFATNNSDGTISSYSIDPVTGVLTDVAGSPFPGVVSTGDTLYSSGVLFVPDASSNSIIVFQPDLSNGVVNRMTGSPFQGGAGPIALTLGGFPVVDPPGGN
ncbi:MAG: beta-propeller fold lactonase family protein [Candidatus Acidiferrum sp.]